MDINGFLDLMIQGKAIKDEVKSFKDMGKSVNGIKARTRDLILQYPVLVSNTLAQETVSAVTRALEHDYANFLVLAINDEGVVDSERGKTTSGYLKAFHNNVLESGNVPKSVLDKVNGEILNEVDSNLFSHINLNDLSINSTKMKIFNEANINPYNVGPENETPEERQRRLDKRDGYNNNIRNTKNLSDIEKNMFDMMEKSGAQLSNSDVRKLNDMSPTYVKGMIQLAIPEVGNVPKPIHFGVKAVAHLLDSEEIIVNLANNINDASLLVKFIEWTTGEKRLFTDLIMRKADMKKLATSKGAGAHWFRKLTMMSNNAKMKKSWEKIVNKMPFSSKAKKIMDDRVPIPTMSLVISKSEVDQIRSKTGLDLLRKENDVKNIMEKLYLLTFIIVDDATEMVYIYDDVSRRYVTYSLKQLKGFAKDDLLTPEQAMKRSLMR